MSFCFGKLFFYFDAFFFLTLGYLQAKIYDCFTFFNEIEILKIRLEELYDAVDHFVLVEGRLTFSGSAKPLYFLENRLLFEPYLDKIIHIIVEDYPSVDPTLEKQQQPWIREAHQRNAILRGLKCCNADDIVIISDVDEIPRLEAILSAKDWILTHRAGLVVSLEMDLFRYHLNRLDQVFSPWKLAIVTKKKTLDRITPHQLRSKQKYHHSIPNSGWHFTSQGGRDSVILKHVSFSHAYDDFVISQIKSFEENFEQILSSFIVLPVDDSWPRRVKRLFYEYDINGFIAH